jgi:hypothetical protein
MIDDEISLTNNPFALLQCNIPMHAGKLICVQVHYLLDRVNMI